MKRVLVLLLLAASSSVFAEGAPSFDQSMEKVAKDLSALHWKIQGIYQRELASNLASSFAEVFSALKTGNSVMVTADSARIYKGAALSAGVVDSVSAGTRFHLLDKVDDWYAVALDKPVQGFSSGWVQAAQSVPYSELAMVKAGAQLAGDASSQSFTDRLYSGITASVRDIQRSYEADPHVGISGFSVDLSIPPGVSILFEFK